MVERRKYTIHTLRADIDYGFAEALTTYGIIELKFGFIKELMAKDVEKEKRKGKECYSQSELNTEKLSKEEFTGMLQEQ